MSLPRASATFVAAALFFLSGCRWLIEFKAYQQCPERPVLVEITEEPQVSVADPPTFRSTAGCTIVLDVKHRSYDGETLDVLSGYEYEVRVEPVEPDGRIERGVLGEEGRVTVPTDVGHTSVSITVFLPDEHFPSGMVEVSAIVLLDPPS